jgi:hypothetical protein
MSFPTDKTVAVDGTTVIVAAHLNNLEDKVGITGSADTNSLDYQAKNHKTRHENAGADEISVVGLSGLLADGQTPLAHKTSHQDAGSDELSVAGLSGVLADKQDANKIQGHAVTETAIANDFILVYKVAGDQFVYEAKGTPAGHKASHQDAGGDEISVTGLSGLLADGQTPLAHKTSHEDGGADEMSVAGLSGVLGDKQDADKIQGHTVDETALANDRVLVYKTSGTKFVYEDKGTPTVHASSHQNGGGDEIDVGGLSGLLADPQTPLGGLIGQGHITILPWHYSGITQGTWVFLADSAQIGTFIFTNNTTHAQNDRIDYKVYLAAGTYTFSVLCETHPGSPIITLLFDEASQGTVDLYSASQTRNVIKTITGIVVATAGLYTVSIKAATRHASANDWLFYLSSISLFRTA